LDVEIEPLTPHVNLAGEWLVIFEAHPACVRLPEHLRLRRYAATITQQGAAVSFAFSGDLQGSTRYSGTLRGDGMVLPVGDWDYPGLTERLTDDQFLNIHGTASAAFTESSGLGYFDGGFNLGTTPNRPFGSGGCTRSDHRVTLQRR
jgi:hypothetical protein